MQGWKELPVPGQYPVQHPVETSRVFHLQKVTGAGTHGYPAQRGHTACGPNQGAKVVFMQFQFLLNFVLGNKQATCSR